MSAVCKYVCIVCIVCMHACKVEVCMYACMSSTQHNCLAHCLTDGYLGTYIQKHTPKKKKKKKRKIAHLAA